jgi:hypothetical protein
MPVGQRKADENGTSGSVDVATSLTRVRETRTEVGMLLHGSVLVLVWDFCQTLKA